MDSFANEKTLAFKERAKPIHCVVEPPLYLNIGNSVFHSGCAVVEVVFPNMALVNIGRITLVNNYTAHLSVKAKVST